MTEWVDCIWYLANWITHKYQQSVNLNTTLSCQVIVRCLKVIYAFFGASIHSPKRYLLLADRDEMLEVVFGK